MINILTSLPHTGSIISEKNLIILGVILVILGIVAFVFFKKKK